MARPPFERDVIPAKAGIQFWLGAEPPALNSIPAFAGMTPWVLAEVLPQARGLALPAANWRRISRERMIAGNLCHRAGAICA